MQVEFVEEILRGWSRDEKDSYYSGEARTVADALVKYTLWRIYGATMIFEWTSPEGIVDFFNAVARRTCAENADDVIMPEKALKKYLSEIEAQVKILYPKLELNHNWRNRVMSFDFLGCRMPLMMTRFLHGEQNDGIAKVDSYPVKVGGVAEKIGLVSKYLPMLGLSGIVFEGERYLGKRIVFPEGTYEENRELIENLIKPALDGIEKYAHTSAEQGECWKALDNIVICKGFWAYAMDADGEGNMMFGGNIDLESVDLDMIIGTFAHELDHFVYMRKCKERGIIPSPFVLEARAKRAYLSAILAIEGGYPCWEHDDADRYETLLSGTDLDFMKTFGRLFGNGYRPDELASPRGRFEGDDIYLGQMMKILADEVYRLSAKKPQSRLRWPIF